MRSSLVVLMSLVPVSLMACSGNDSPGTATGGSSSNGGSVGTGGASTGTGGASTGTGGASTGTGGGVSTGGASPGAGGGSAGSGNATGGALATGGAGGSSAGGEPAKGGAASGGEPAKGGAAAGGAGNGGAATGGAGGAITATGGAGGATPSANPCRGTKATGFVADGLCAVQVASVTNVRQIVFSSNGDLWATSSNGPIRRLRDANANGTYETTEIVQWATTGGNGQNVHIDEAGGFLYSGNTAGVRRWAWTATSDSGGAGEDVMTGQPGNGNHPKHTVHVWDGFMYVMSGSSGNVSNENSSKSTYDTTRSLIKRFPVADLKSGSPVAWSAGEVFSNGLRNILGFNRDAMGRMYGVQNGQDDVTYGGQDVHNDNPGEVIVRLEMGSSHGYPFCYVAQAISGVAAGTQVASPIYASNPHNDAWCQANAVAPVIFTQAHSAPMDIIFFTQNSTTLPARWKGGAFVTLHGSWNRNPGSGKKVVWVPFNADGTSPKPTTSGTTTTFPYEVVFGESADKVASGSGASSNGGLRPVGIAISPVDGALYISSDGDGRIYRVGLQQ